MLSVSTPAAVSLRQPAGRRRGPLPRDPISASDVEALLACCSRRAPTGVRNAALIAVLWRCGLRVGEALDLRPRDLDLDERVLRVQRGKGGRSRVVGIDSGTVALLERWIAVRRTKIGRRDTTLFCTLGGNRLHDSYVRRALPRLARRAGVERRIHGHGLRHRYALDLVAEGATLVTVRDLLGHASAATTDTYLRRIGAGDAVKFSQDRTWSA